MKRSRTREESFWVVLSDLSMSLFVLFLSLSASGLYFFSQLRNEFLVDVGKTVATPQPADRIVLQIQDLVKERRELWPEPDLLPEGHWTPLPMPTATATPNLNNRRCAREGAELFLKGMEDCMAEKGLALAITDTGCILRFSEDLIKFGSGKDILTGIYRANVEKIADCLVAQADRLRQSAYWNELDVISIDGHTDCQAGEAFNRDLSLRRAKRVWEEILTSSAMGRLRPKVAQAISSRITARGFGELRQTMDSPCDCKSPELCTPDRRVEIRLIWTQADDQSQSWHLPPIDSSP